MAGLGRLLPESPLAGGAVRRRRRSVAVGVRHGQRHKGYYLVKRPGQSAWGNFGLGVANGDDEADDQEDDAAQIVGDGRERRTEALPEFQS